VTSLRWITVETPIGPVSAGCSDVGVAQTRFGRPPGRAVAGSAMGDAAGSALGDAAGSAMGDAAGSALGDAAGSAMGDAAGAAREEVAEGAREQLVEYFGGARTVFELPLDWGECAGARLAVLELLAETVEYGQTVNYGTLAQRLADRDGRPSIGARAIGAIMGSNPIPVIVPCHRVVAADGLGGFSGGCGVELKRWLLTFEGALPAMLDFGTPVGLAL
jgi:methylated-DNA-[protein]-cysteine S-methyltransferase